MSHIVRCKVVGVGRYTSVPPTPDDPICLEAEPSNAHDSNALKVKAWMEGRWMFVGYVDRAHAETLAGREVSAARLVTAGNGFEIPMSVEVA
jgi:hypothetical protein